MPIDHDEFMNVVAAGSIIALTFDRGRLPTAEELQSLMNKVPNCNALEAIPEYSLLMAKLIQKYPAKCEHLVRAYAAYSGGIAYQRCCPSNPENPNPGDRS